MDWRSSNHGWQSTLFVLAAALVAAALRRNGAHVRHAVWVVASLKFLMPFALLMSLGSTLSRFTPAVTDAIAPVTAAAPDFSIAVDRIAQPFTSDVFPALPFTATQPAVDWTAFAMAGTWACGFVAVALIRLRGWRRIRAAVRASVPLALVSPVPVRSSPGLLGPGVVGVWRPILLMPAEIERHLTPAQIHAVLEHELCHIRRRDNLTAAIHMVVEAAFWFHPLVWWIGARMLDERERACDEQVLRVCGEPLTYAESILNVCRLYDEVPLACVSGVTMDLKKRIAAIMVNRVGLQLNLARKAALTTAAMLAILLPLIAGVLTAPLRASANASASRQSAASVSPTFDVVSIKPCPEIRPSTGGASVRPGGGRGGGAAPWAAQTSPGYVHWDCATLAQLVEQAYADVDHPLLNTTDRAQPDSFQPKRVRGGPSWVEKDKFTIEAKASLDVTNPALRGSSNRNLLKLPAAMSQALRATLADRFQLKVQRATEQQHLYALGIAKNGLNPARVKATKPSDCVPADEYFATDPATRGDLRICGRYLVTMTAWDFKGGTLQQLANALSSMMDRFVLDRTGIDGMFNFTLDFEPAAEDNPPGDGRFIRALERLGLKIEETKGPAEYFAIESVQTLRPDGADDSVAPPARARGPLRSSAR